MNTQEAFETLLNSLHATIEDAKVQLADATAHGQFNKVIALGKRCEELQTQIKNLEALRHKWGELVGKSISPVKRRNRAKRKYVYGLKTPQQAYRLPILNTLVKMGGSGQARDVLEAVYDQMKSVLNEYDHGLLQNGSTPRWRNTAEFERNTMRKEGLIKSDSPLGIWEISEKGLKWLQEHET